ncbi:TRAP transporter permease [Marinomonas mediterranea]|jgi:TRAP transporter, 4TM/12TM fusion protein|uniref:TRAP transporter, 4TM/12TM fusion protein n=1 Tax=Marinomonas mediterranea (strain ATCC 700492 / JCM 21426 / NBRC 103028 / MMB-1) TaxID=717774 RepID=F2JVL9_MARM1|nr:TRAP transporter permease [Marinomonas mediterranea]ADZ90563.1 TRAP transporter, 4TM/12TM fusion protein [Marinomonas mediterranea MMB-1]WCN08610.1 TRAP transporter fused permease subunit [Marinomonas mediterranea]WCN12664.1 TRAP transporter fused permease subunit [Marinomonas mediterranea]WCN16738.1 TRAP transporter fused permease subunit [Marinomonas mediterranea MMB-1]
MSTTTSEPASNDKLEELVAEADTGKRVPTGKVALSLLFVLPLCWSLFQLWIGSPLPSQFGIGFLNDTQSRALHLAFAVLLAFLAFPAFSKSPTLKIPVLDYLFAFAAAFCASYLFLFYDDLAMRPGLPTTLDLVVSTLGLVLTLEAARRSLGPPLAIVAIIFLLYVFFGDASWLPEVIRWKGASLEKAMTHMWLTTEGVFGIALGVSSGFVFLFVLFGALLNQAGAGNYFIQVAFSLLGHMRGGPAKAAVLSSAMTGLISGSSIANVVTTGTFTIPLMKKVGFSPEKAGAVEVSSSVNGVIMPPVMGAVAFLMVEYVGIPYIEVVKHAFLPATISYIALLYIVHLEAMKADMKGLPRSTPARRFSEQLIRTGIIVSSMLIVLGALYYLIVAIKWLMGDFAHIALVMLVVGGYFGLLFVSSKSVDLDLDTAGGKIEKLPIFADIYKSGLYYLVPLVVLVWFLMVERKSPGLSAFWACMLMAFILFTQKPLKAWFRQKGKQSSVSGLSSEWKSGLVDLVDGLNTGARNMIGIGVATATAGIIVGTVTLTGVGQVMAEFVELISGGVLIIMLLMVALISLVLGMGLPTTANYIVVSSLMASVVVELGAQSGLIVPMIAVHMFVFYFGIMADVTPPVGLASFAAAAVSGGDPIKTGFTAFFYSMRTALLPFLFIFNTDLLLIDVTWWQAIFVFIVSLTAMLVFAAATQGYFFTRSKLWESAVLILVAFTLFRPGFWLDQVEAPYSHFKGSEMVAYIDANPSASEIRLSVEGENLEGRWVEKTVNLPLSTAGSAADRLYQGAGLEVRNEDGKTYIDNMNFGSPAEKQKLDFDWEITGVEVENNRPAKEWFFIPAFILLAWVAMRQRKRA